MIGMMWFAPRSPTTLVGKKPTTTSVKLWTEFWSTESSSPPTVSLTPLPMPIESATPSVRITATMLVTMSQPNERRPTVRSFSMVPSDVIEAMIETTTSGATDARSRLM